jgi:DNA-binding NarL/FixJ family response regulator
MEPAAGKQRSKTLHKSRKEQVADMLAHGSDDAQIAATLGIKLATAKLYVKQVWQDEGVDRGVKEIVREIFEDNMKITKRKEDKDTHANM